MNIKNKILLLLSKGILGRNQKFKNIHKGDSCYIFGNGISLKDMDLKKFGDKISIGCGYLFLHNDFDALNLKYYCEAEPYWFYPYWKNRGTGEVERNRNSALQKRVIKQHPEIEFFTSLSNLFGLTGRNISYLHHFDIPTFGADTFDLEKEFYFRGALHVMIGMAIYMGFEKAYLVGCDYTHSPQRVLHFYEKGKGKIQYDDSHNADFFRVAQEKIDLITVTSNGSMSKTLEHIDYEDLTGEEAVFRENTGLVRKEYLDILADYYDYSIY